MEKGTRVRVVRGREQGQRGVVFWSGPSKYGGGVRLGVTADAGAKLWVSADECEAEEGAPSPAAYPFRFYGHGCFGDWIEGALDGHCFTVQFERAPDADELHLLGELFTEQLKSGPARPSHNPWEWSGAWALFLVGERGSPGAPAIVSRIERFLSEAHELVPLIDVVYFNARAGTDDWDDWSMKQGPPTPGPFLVADLGLFHRPHDPSIPAPAPSEPFERGRVAVERAEEKVALDAAIEKQANKRIRLERISGDELPPPPDAFAWDDDAFAGFEVPSPQVLRYEEPSGSWNEWQAGDHPLRDVPGRRLAWVVAKAGEAASNLAWLDDEGARRTPDKWRPSVSGHQFGQVVVHPTGRHAIVAVDRMEYLRCKGQMLYRLDFEAGRARAIYTLDTDTDGGLGRVLFVLGGERLAVSTGKRLFLLDTGADKPVPIAATKQNGGALVPAFDGRALLADTGRSWRLYGLGRETIKNLGTITNRATPDFEIDGRAFWAAREDHFELVGAANAVERFRRKLGED